VAAPRLRTADPAQVDAALARVRDGEPEGADLRLLTKHFLAVLESRAPGHSVEVREDAEEAGAVRASGERADLSPYLPLG
jgi:hypothetical protein